MPALTCLSCAGLSAQQPENPRRPRPEVPTPESPEVEKPEERRRIESEVAERLREIREGKVVQSHVRVTVWLTNENRLFGVVKNGRFVEKHNGSRFVEANPNETAVGIRLWYSDNTNSYIFLPFDSIARYRIGERLSDEQVRDLGDALQRAADDRAAKAREMAETRRREGQEPGEGGGDGPRGPAPAPEGESSGMKLSPEEAALLKEFPPSAGWGPEKKAELERRRVVLGVFPNAVERKFLENFEAWSAAARKQETIDAAKARSGETPIGVPGRTGGPGTGPEAEGSENEGSRERGRRTRGGRPRRYRGETGNESGGSESPENGGSTTGPAGGETGGPGGSPTPAPGTRGR